MLNADLFIVEFAKETVKNPRNLIFLQREAKKILKISSQEDFTNNAK